MLTLQPFLRFGDPFLRLFPARTGKTGCDADRLRTWLMPTMKPFPQTSARTPSAARGSRPQSISCTQLPPRIKKSQTSTRIVNPPLKTTVILNILAPSGATPSF